MSANVRLEELFHIEYGTRFDLKQMCQTTAEDPDGISFVSRSQHNLGVVAYVKPFRNISPLEAGLITVSLGGSYVLSGFIQERPFYTAQNIAVLTPKAPLTFRQKLFYCICLRMNRFRYSAFGREANRTLGQIRVPASMPHAFRRVRLSQAVPATRPILDTGIEIGAVEWREFLLTDLFDIAGTVTTPIRRLKSYGGGDSPYITTQTVNNGVLGFYGHATEKGNVLVVDSAVTGYCSYQPDDFSASDHVEKLIPRFDMNKYVGMFLATVMKQDQYRYNDGRKASQARLRKMSIRLPSTAEGKPNWQFMEDFIKSLSYSRSL